MSITLEQAKNLTFGTILYHTRQRNADGTAQRWRVNGKPKTWKTRPNEVQIPVKHGLRHFGYVTEAELELVSLEDPTAQEADR